MCIVEILHVVTALVFYLQKGPAALTDAEILILVRNKHIPAYKLEAALGQPERGVAVRRQLIQNDLPSHTALENLPHKYVYINMIESAGQI